MLTDTDDERAEVLSNFFASVFTEEPRVTERSALRQPPALMTIWG